MEYSYHGTTYLCDKVSNLYTTGIKKMTQSNDIQFIKRYSIEDFEDKIEKHSKDGIGCFIVEIIQGVGIMTYLKSLLLESFKFCKKHKIITICDEVEIHFGF